MRRVNIDNLSTGLLRKPAAIVGLALLALGAKPSFAQPGDLNFFKNYFVTVRAADSPYVVGGVGLRGLGDATGFATGTIVISGVPDGADAVAAFLYWQTVERSRSAFAGQIGFFGHINGDGSVTSYTIAGTILGNPNAPVSWSAGGCAGNSQGTTTLRTYRADVRPFLPVVNGKHAANGSFQVRLADSGSNGGGTPLTLGATLVVIYRLLSPTAVSKVAVIYDGSFAPSNSSSSMNQTIQGFYQAANASPMATLTHIVGNGQSNKLESLYFNGNLISAAPFPGALNGSWDNPTFDVSAYVPGGDTSPVTTAVLPAATNSGCVSWGAVIFGTMVKVSDNDSHVDIWKTSLGPPGCMGAGCTPGFTDVADGSFVALPGAAAGQKDLFVQIDYMVSRDAGGTILHSHLPKQAALDMVCSAFAAQGIHVHFDVGGNYQNGDPCIVPSAFAKGGNVIDENSAACQDNAAATPPFFCEFPGEAATSWKGGFTLLKNQLLNPLDPTSRRFPHNRRHTHHEVIFGHELGLATTNWSIASGTLTSIVVSSNVATVTTVCPAAPAPCPALPSTGARVTVSGALSDFDLNGTYFVQSVPSATTFTFSIPAMNVSNGTYNNTNNPGLVVGFGPASSNSGWSDLGGADTIITFGKWHWDDPAGCQPNPAVALAAGQVYCNDQTGRVQAQAGTLMHEVGHTKGLRHGGAYNANASGVATTFGLNCKSNYQSVMNYQFQIRGLPRFDGGGPDVGYSGQILPDLAEGSLSEPAGIGAAAATYRTRWFAPVNNNFLASQLNTVVGGLAATRHCNGTPLAPAEVGTMMRLEGPLASPAINIDYNNNGVIDPSPLPAQDINFNGSTADSPFAGFNDWTGPFPVDLRQISARRGVLGFSTDVWGSADTGGGGSADSGGGGSADTGGGGSADSGGGGSADSGGGGSADTGGGGSADSGGGGSGSEGDFDLANSTVDPPINLTAVEPAGAKFVNLNWSAPGFGRIRTYYVWRVNITKAPMSPTNLPQVIGTVTGTPPVTNFTDGTVSNNNTYTYFVTAALGADSGPNNGNQSGPSNMRTITIDFSKGATGQ